MVLFLIISKMSADGHLGMTALSRVILASAGLSCFYPVMTLSTLLADELLLLLLLYSIPEGG